MAENDPDPGQPLDVEKIHYLVRLMKRYDLTDLNIRDGQVQIRLRRRGPESHVTRRRIPPRPIPRPDPSNPGPASPRSPPPGQVRRGTADDRHQEPHGRHLLCLERPDAPPFVTVGFRRAPREHGLHHRGHEGLHRYPRRGHRHDRRGPGQERPAGRVRPAPVPRDPGLILRN